MSAKLQGHVQEVFGLCIRVEGGFMQDAEVVGVQVGAEDVGEGPPCQLVMNWNEMYWFVRLFL